MGPLIDGTDAIVLTLLVLELPAFVLDVLHDYIHAELGFVALLDSLISSVAGYLALFLIV